MATEENPLLNLSADKQRELVDVVEKGNIAKIAQATGLSRRQVMAIGAALVGSAGAGGFAANEVIGSALADASTTDSDGNVGLPNDRVDVFAEAIDSNSVNTEGLTLASTIKTATSDSELDSLTLNDGDRVLLGSGDFGKSRTISARVDFVGAANTVNSAGAQITGNWTLSSPGTTIRNVNLDGVTLSVDGTLSRVDNVDMVNSASISVGADRVILRGISRESVTFASGTSGGLLDSSVAVSVTDNGTNTVGDNA